MRSDLSGKVSLVTGAARGIGQAIADRLAASGSRVVYTDVDAEEVKRAAARHPGGTALALDVTRPEQIVGVIEQVVLAWGTLDIVVNNAGINSIEHRVPVDEYPRSEWDRILAVDLTGLYEVSKAAATVMRARGSGRIINIASIAGLVPLRLQSAFVAAKAGVINLTRAMALELGPHGILVNGIAPGSTLTEGTRRLFYGDDGKFRDRVQQMLDHVPLGRPGTVDEIAVAALFLAEPENTYMNGHIIVETALRKLRRDLGTDAAGGKLFVDDQKPPGPGHRAGDGVDIERRDRSRIDQLNRDPFAGQLRAGFKRIVNHQGQGDDRDIAPFTNDRRLSKADLLIAFGNQSLDCEKLAMLEEEYRIVAPEGMLEQSPSIARVRGHDHPQSWILSEQCVVIAGVMSGRRMADADAPAQHDRHLEPPTAHVGDLGNLVDNLADTIQHEVSEHEIDHGASSGHGGSTAQTNEPSLANGGVAKPLRPEAIK